MDVFAKYVSGIDNPDHRLKAEEILSWTAGQFPNLEAQIKWNNPTFTDHGTYIIMYQESRLFRIRWTDPVHYDLLKKIIEFNIKEKAENPGFWR
ncbi:iron chaperone [Bacillus velezensis]